MYLWNLNAGGPLELHVARFFRNNSLWAIITKKGSKGFSIILKTCFIDLMEMTLNMILSSILLYKSHIWENCCSWVIAGKAFNQLDCSILWSHIPPDVITGSHWLSTCKQTAGKVKKINYISQSCRQYGRCS